MIDIKQAVKIAKQHALEMFNQANSNLEEFERESYKGHEVWSITLSFPRDMRQMGGFTALTIDPLQYKRFLVDFETGELLAIIVREMASR